MGTTRCGPARQPTWLVRGSVARFLHLSIFYLPTYQPISLPLYLPTYLPCAHLARGVVHHLPAALRAPPRELGQAARPVRAHAAAWLGLGLGLGSGLGLGLGSGSGSGSGLGSELRGAP